MSTMRLNKQNSLICLILLIELVFAPSIFAQDYKIEPTPGWVKPIQAQIIADLDQQDNSNGIAYLLVDRQWKILEEQQFNYQHFVNKALNTSGVTEASQISINYDPTYESIILHKIKIHRNGTIIDRINRSQISLIQREKNLEYQIYDGSKTLNIFVEDVRPGDYVEYSYTIEGANPILAGHFSEKLDMAWDVPVGRVRYRVLWASSHPLFIKNHKTDIEPVLNVSGQQKEYIWSLDKVSASNRDEETPGWYVPFPVVYLSDMAKWEEVTAWALPLYRPVTDTQSMKEIRSSILKKTANTEQRVIAALRFVQDEVRYLGVEIGVNSHKPTIPDKVLEQRFGDCKDKSRLLVTILRGMGIEADSVLVNSYSGRHLNNVLPNPAAFDHVIVLARVNGKNYWLDPTRTYQNGTLDTLYKPNYDYALVVSAKYPDLVKMSDDIRARHSKTVVETFDISGAIDKPASYKIITDFEGYYADSTRGYLAESNPSQIQRSYLNYTAHYYPDVQAADKIKVSDDATLNKLTITEYYSVPNIWATSDDERFVSVEFTPFLIMDYIKDARTPVRTTPYAIAHPVRFQHTTRIHVPEDSKFKDEFIEVKDPAFNFTKKVSFSDDILAIDYIYESLSDNVNPEDILTYSKNINEVQNFAFYQAIMPNPAIDFGEYHFKSNDINWVMVVAVLLSLLGFSYLSIKYVYLYDPPYQTPNPINSQLEGLTGWLILPGLSLILSPIKILSDSSKLWYVFSAQQWSIVKDYFGEVGLFTISLEMICNVFLIVVTLVLILMFLTRRHTFPRFFIIYIVLMLVLVSIDLLVSQLISSPGTEIPPRDVSQWMRQSFYVIVWSLYFTKSERVKATFTCQRSHRNSLQSTLDTEQELIIEDVTSV